MNFKLVSSILRSTWLLNKDWASAHLPVVISAITGKGSFAGLSGDDDFDKEKEKTEAVLHFKNSAGVVYRVSSYTNLSSLPDGTIAMLTLSGAVTKYGGMCSYGSVDHTNTVNKIANSPNIKGLILNVDSPGGEASGTSMLADAIKNLSTRKPVISIVDDGMAASAAMWIASSGNEIYATKKTDTFGSIGVYTTIADWVKYYESIGLTVKEIYAPQSTDKNQTYYQALEGNEEPIKEDLKVLAKEFIDTISRNRSGKIKGTAWQTGKMFYANEATSIGLIDGIKSFDQVVRRMDKLIREKDAANSNNMAFEKTLSVAGATEFEVVDGGFLLTEEYLTKVDTALETGSTAAAELATTKQELTQVKNSISTKDAEIQRLNAEVTRLSALPSGKGTQVAGPKADATAEEEEEKAVKYDDPNHPANVAADKATKKYQGWRK